LLGIGSSFGDGVWEAKLAPSTSTVLLTAEYEPSMYPSFRWKLANNSDRPLEIREFYLGTFEGGLGLYPRRTVDGKALPVGLLFGALLRRDRRLIQPSEKFECVTQIMIGNLDDALVDSDVIVRWKHAVSFQNIPFRPEYQGEITIKSTRRR
jgi:hypothetical protein